MTPQTLTRHVSTATCLDPPPRSSTEAPLEGEYCSLSKPFVALDVVWNLAFVVVSVFVLLTTIRERPSTPLRVWIGGYASLCLLHVGFVFFQYRRQVIRDGGEARVFSERVGFSLRNNCIVKRLESMNTVVSSIWWVFGFYWIVMGGQALLQDSPRLYCIVKRLESMNTVVSSIWWVFGFYWIVMGGQALLQDSPRLYWYVLSISLVFLAFDVFFMILCVVMASVVFFTLFCCLPILATIAYAMKLGGGASDKDLKSLPRYKFHINSLTDVAPQAEDSECCICLNKYVEGSELCSLPCKHHFHNNCICKWLKINATCPLCKYNILRADATLV